MSSKSFFSDYFLSSVPSNQWSKSSELLKISGEIAPADDARDAKYFPIDKLPKLAFYANRRAVDQFKKIYRLLPKSNVHFKSDSIKFMYKLTVLEIKAVLK